MFGLPDIRSYVILVLVAACATLGLSTCEYRKQFKAATYALDVQNQAIKANRDLVNRKLLQLTEQRDAAYAEQEKKDREAANQISDLARKLRDAPIRVRCIPEGGDAGGSGGRAQAQGAGAGAQNVPDAYGVLPAGNSRRLKAVIGEMNKINEAYRSCRDSLLKDDEGNSSGG